jgi:hypothetical protein
VANDYRVRQLRKLLAEALALAVHPAQCDRSRGHLRPCTCAWAELTIQAKRFGVELGDRR